MNESYETARTTSVGYDRGGTISCEVWRDEGGFNKHSDEVVG